jgi:hypothetical protein
MILLSIYVIISVLSKANFFATTSAYLSVSIANSSVPGMSVISYKATAFLK